MLYRSRLSWTAVFATISACSTTNLVGADDCIEAAKPTCFPASDGICDDSGSVAPTCTSRAWSCPAGAIPREWCRCGVPPVDACLKDSGLDIVPDTSAPDAPDGVVPDGVAPDGVVQDAALPDHSVGPDATDPGTSCGDAAPGCLDDSSDQNDH
jgi:hypothetical protein